jgi:hypothetical protein
LRIRNDVVRSKRQFRDFLQHGKKKKLPVKRRQLFQKPIC